MKKLNQSILVFALAALLLTVAVGSTLAFLADKTESIANTFTPTQVSVTVSDTVEGFTKKNVVITNTSNIKAYVRFAVVANWQDSANRVIAGWNDFGNIKLSDGWTLSDGYYYYEQPVNPGQSLTVDESDTEVFYTFKGKVPADVYGNPADHLQMDILVQAIQAEGMGATSAQDAFSKAAASN